MKFSLFFLNARTLKSSGQVAIFVGISPKLVVSKFSSVCCVSFTSTKLQRTLFGERIVVTYEIIATLVTKKYEKFFIRVIPMLARTFVFTPMLSPP